MTLAECPADESAATVESVIAAIERAPGAAQSAFDQTTLRALLLVQRNDPSKAEDLTGRLREALRDARAKGYTVTAWAGRLEAERAMQLGSEQKAQRSTRGTTANDSREANARHTAEAERNGAKYMMEPGRIRVLRQSSRGDDIEVELLNASVVIVEDIVTLDASGASIDARRYRVETMLRADNVARVCEVKAADFDRPRWIDEHLGSAALLPHRPSDRAELFGAIRLLSGGRTTKATRYSFSGWAPDEAGFTRYVFTGGSITRESTEVDTSVSAQVPKSMQRFALELPSTPDEEREAVRLSLRILRARPADVMTTVVAVAYRAPLGGEAPSVHLLGQGNSGKTFAALLAQLHFGRGFSKKSLAASWLRASEAGMRSMFAHARDCVLGVDDYKPSTDRATNDTRARAFDVVTRDAVDGTSEAKATRDGQLRDAPRPAVALLSTGESLPEDESGRTRLFVVRCAGTNWTEQSGDNLDDVAESAMRRGMLAKAMGGYVRFVARKLGASGVDALRRSAAHQASGEHDERLSANVAGLLAGIDGLLRYARHIDAIEGGEADELYARASQTIAEIARRQRAVSTEAAAHEAAMKALRAGLAAGWCHLERLRDGGRPTRLPPERTGHQYEPTSGTYVPRGERIGYVDDNRPGTVFVIRDNFHAFVERRLGARFTLSSNELYARLHQNGWLTAGDFKSSTGCVTHPTVMFARVPGSNCGKARLVHVSEQKLFELDDIDTHFSETPTESATQNTAESVADADWEDP